MKASSICPPERKANPARYIVSSSPVEFAQLTTPFAYCRRSTPASSTVFCRVVSYRDAIRGPKISLPKVASLTAPSTPPKVSEDTSVRSPAIVDSASPNVDSFWARPFMLVLVSVIPLRSSTSPVSYPYNVCTPPTDAV